MMGIVVAVKDVGLPPPGCTLRESMEWAEHVGRGILADLYAAVLVTKSARAHS